VLLEVEESAVLEVVEKGGVLRRDKLDDRQFCARCAGRSADQNQTGGELGDEHPRSAEFPAGARLFVWFEARVSHGYFIGALTGKREEVSSK
jgi:hypothetical protein